MKEFEFSRYGRYVQICSHKAALYETLAIYQHNVIAMNYFADNDLCDPEVQILLHIPRTFSGVIMVCAVWRFFSYYYTKISR